MNTSQIIILSIAGLIAAGWAVSFVLPLMRWPAAKAKTISAADRVAIWETLRQACCDAKCCEAVKQLDVVFPHLAGKPSE